MIPASQDRSKSRYTFDQADERIAGVAITVDALPADLVAIGKIEKLKLLASKAALHGFHIAGGEGVVVIQSRGNQEIVTTSRLVYRPNERVGIEGVLHVEGDKTRVMPVAFNPLLGFLIQPAFEKYKPCEILAGLGGY